MGIQSKITENVSSQCFFCRKTLKWMQTNQYQETEKTLQKRYILSVFELVTYKKMLKLIQSTLYWETEGHCEKCIMSVL